MRDYVSARKLALLASNFAIDTEENLENNLKAYENIDDAKILAQDILSKLLDANVGCALIASIAAKLGYPDCLEEFSILAHVQSGHEQVGILPADCVDDIFEACHVLLQISAQ